MKHIAKILSIAFCGVVLATSFAMTPARADDHKMNRMKPHVVTATSHHRRRHRHHRRYDNLHNSMMQRKANAMHKAMMPKKHM